MHGTERRGQSLNAPAFVFSERRSAMRGMYEPRYRFFSAGEMAPRGWLRRQLEIQAAGLSGHLHEVWPDVRDSAWIGGKAEGSGAPSGVVPSVRSSNSDMRLLLVCAVRPPLDARAARILHYVPATRAQSCCHGANSMEWGRFSARGPSDHPAECTLGTITARRLNSRVDMCSVLLELRHHRKPACGP